MKAMRRWAGQWRSLGLMISCVLFGCAGGARAQDASSWKDIETKYIFGFTTGSGIGLEGEKEFTIDTIGRFGKRDGHYAATETKYEFEFTPSQFIQIEFGALGATHNIGGVTDLDDRSQFALSGAFAEFRYLALERTSSNPLAVTLAVEPTVRRIDETSGERVRNFELETIINADLELMRNRLFAGFNLLYEPEVTRTAMGDTLREAKFGGSAALSLRIASNIVVGGEVWYLRHYDSIGLSAFSGDAVMLGPTLYIAFTPKMFMTAAWNTQVGGREVGNPVSLNLAEFQRNRARLKFAWEFLSSSTLERLTCVCCKYDDEKTDISCYLRDLDACRVSVSSATSDRGSCDLFQGPIPAERVARARRQTRHFPSQEPRRQSHGV